MPPCRAIEGNGSQPLTGELGLEAEKLAARHRLASPEALQIAVALRLGLAEFYTPANPGSR